MTRISFIGAGSIVFTRALANDILLTPSLQDAKLVLMDINPERLDLARRAVQAIIDRRGLKATVEATTELRTAVTGADYVITTFQQVWADGARARH